MLVEQKYPSGRVVRNGIDVNGDLAKVESKKNVGDFYRPYGSNFVYNAAGAVTSMRLGNGKFENTQFNSRLQPTQIGLGSSVSDYGLLNLSYDYGTTNNNGNVMSQQITVKRNNQSPLIFNQTYVYDSLNRLKSAEEKTGAMTTWKQVYEFDRYGNRNFVENETTTLLKECNGNTEVCAAIRPIVNPSVNAANNRLNGYTFDASGNTITDAEGRTFTYDAENKQVEVENSLSQTIGQYMFDGDGKRIKKIVPSTGEVTIFVYDAGGKSIAEYSTIVASSQEAKVNYLTNDHLGSPRINTDQNGNVTARHDYHPFGEEIIGTGGRTQGLNYTADDVRKQFTGYERDDESDLDFAQARYYKPAYGRFTSTDPLLSSGRIEDPQTWNRYAYVLNNPLAFIDPTGSYECDASASKSCDKFEKARQGLEKARDYYQKKGDNQKADALTNTLKAIGTLNDNNGLTIAIGKVAKGAAAETSFGLTKDGKPLLAKDSDGKGNYVANVIITFKSSDEMTVETLAHEGSHVEDHQKLVAAIFAESAKDPLFDDEKTKALPENLTKYATESKAYHNSSYIQEYTNTEGEYWKRGWQEVDRQKAIDRTLKSSDLYKVTPKDQGRRL